MRNQESRLLTRTLELLKASPLSNKEIAKGCGCTLQYIHMMRNGCKSIPSVALIERMYEFLSGHRLEIL